jgi:uncharacterized protein (DUF427 family)
VYYIPRRDVQEQFLSRTDQRSFCEFKGLATYYTIRVEEKVSGNAAWSYSEPLPSYEAIRGYMAFYPARVDACYVDSERVQSQEGDFYGGWITSDIEGPFKGGPGTTGW